MRATISPWVALALLAGLGCPKPPPAPPKRELYLELPTGVGSKGKSSPPVSKKPPPTPPETPPTAPIEKPKSLVLGAFDLADTGPVIDGDSFRIPALPRDIRLQGVDCEEVFLDPEARALADKDFAAYAKKMQGERSLPETYPTPFGDEAKEFAELFFAFGGRVTLEYDDPNHATDYFGRHLVHLFFDDHGTRVHYNLELVRRGYSPYVTKFGSSERFDKEFRAAEEEARAKKLGIWDPKKKHYPDYDARRRWWDRRSRAIDIFEERYRAKAGYLRLDDDDASERLQALVGQTVTVFGSAYGVREDGRPARLLLAHKKGADFALVSFDEKRWAAESPKKLVGEYLYIKGTVSLYYGQPQMKLDDGAIVSLEPL